MGGLPCARNGGSVAIRDSTMAAQILRMDHTLTSRHGLNDDFFVWMGSVGVHAGKAMERNCGGSFPTRFLAMEANQP
jgi:hypothetical protein